MNQPMSRLAETLRGALQVLDATAGLTGDLESLRAVRLRQRGRDYGVAFFALADELAAEFPDLSIHPGRGSVLDQMRTDAFLVASKCQRIAAGLRPNGRIPRGSRDDLVALLLVVDELIAELDRRIACRRLPMRATSYLRARDQLRDVLDPLMASARAGPEVVSTG